MFAVAYDNNVLDGIEILVEAYFNLIVCDLVDINFLIVVASITYNEGGRIMLYVDVELSVYVGRCACCSIFVSLNADVCSDNRLLSA